MRKGCLLFFVAILLISHLSIVAAQSNSDYLQSLEGEASELDLDNKTKNANQSSNAASSVSKEWSGQGGAIFKLTPGLSFDQFEVVLKNNYIGSFLFYKRLSNSQKDRVFKFYQDNPDPSKIREKILQVSKE